MCCCPPEDNSCKKIALIWKVHWFLDKHVSCWNLLLFLLLDWYLGVNLRTPSLKVNSHKFPPTRISFKILFYCSLSQGIFPCSYVQVRPTTDQERYAAVTKSPAALYGFLFFWVLFNIKFYWLHGITFFFIWFSLEILTNTFFRSGVGITTIR